MSAFNVPSSGMMKPGHIMDFVRSPVDSPNQSKSIGSTFAEILSDKLPEDSPNVRFSMHAQERMALRNIDVNQDTITQLNDAMDMAQEKGAHDSVVIMKDKAFVVNVDKRMVVTAFDNTSAFERMFTQIDSAVVLK